MLTLSTNGTLGNSWGMDPACFLTDDEIHGAEMPLEAL